MRHVGRNQGALRYRAVHRTMSVKPSSMRRAPPVEKELQARATRLTREAAGLLEQARSGAFFSDTAPRLSKEVPNLISQAEERLAEAERVDAASPVLHLTRCDLANMRGDCAATVPRWCTLAVPWPTDLRARG